MISRCHQYVVCQMQILQHGMSDVILLRVFRKVCPGFDVTDEVVEYRSFLVPFDLLAGLVFPGEKFGSEQLTARYRLEESFLTFIYVRCIGHVQPFHDVQPRHTQGKGLYDLLVTRAVNVPVPKDEVQIVRLEEESLPSG